MSAVGMNGTCWANYGTLVGATSRDSAYVISMNFSGDLYSFHGAGIFKTNYGAFVGAPFGDSTYDILINFSGDLYALYGAATTRGLGQKLL